MISTLHIKNIGIIDDLSIDLNEGLNVLTGETGAGKTLIIDSLEIISGGRFSKEMIRKGETNSFVEICMYEPENENSIDEKITDSDTSKIVYEIESIIDEVEYSKDVGVSRSRAYLKI